MTLEYFLIRGTVTFLNWISMLLGKLEENNFIINPRKCEWTIKETDWLGYWLTPE